MIETTRKFLCRLFVTKRLLKKALRGASVSSEKLSDGTYEHTYRFPTSEGTLYAAGMLGTTPVPVEMINIDDYPLPLCHWDALTSTWKAIGDNADDQAGSEKQ